MVKKVPKWSKFVSNCPKRSQLFKNGPKLFKMVQKDPTWSKIIQNYPKWSTNALVWCNIFQNIAPYGWKVTKMVQNGQKLLKIVQNHSTSKNWSKAVQNVRNLKIPYKVKKKEENLNSRKLQKKNYLLMLPSLAKEVSVSHMQD